MIRLLTILFTLLTLNLFAQTNRIEYSQPNGTLHYIDVPVVTSILPSVALQGVKDTLLYNGVNAIDFVIMGDGFTAYPPLVVTNQIGAEVCPVSGWILQTTTGGNPPYSFLWSNGNTEQSISFLTTGTYYCTVYSTDNQTVASTYYVSSQNIGTATGLGFTAIGNTKIKITCFTVPYANRYQFYYRKSGNTTWQSKQVTVPSVTISNLIPNTLYEFKVRGRCYVSPTYKSGAFSTVSTYATAMRIEFEPLEQNQPFVIYNLLGEIVYTGTRIPYNLIPGSYIVTKGNTIKKIVIIN